MLLIVKNNSSDALSYAAGTVAIPAASDVSISQDFWFALLTDNVFIADLRKNNIILNDGITTYNYPESETFLRQIASTDNISNKDTDGASIVRNKAARKGWTYCSLPLEFETARLSDTLYSKDSAGNNRTFITMKSYDANDVEITTPGVLNANYANIAKTVIDFEPTYDFEIIGGVLRTLTTISSDVRLWIVAVPDIPAPTGSKEMGGGINLRYLAPGNEFSVDGRVTKFAAYNATYHTNKIRMIFKYPPGTNESFQVVIELYKA